MWRKNDFLKLKLSNSGVNLSSFPSGFKHKRAEMLTVLKDKINQKQELSPQSPICYRKIFPPLLYLEFSVSNMCHVSCFPLFSSSLFSRIWQPNKYVFPQSQKSVWYPCFSLIDKGPKTKMANGFPCGLIKVSGGVSIWNCNSGTPSRKAD